MALSPLPLSKPCFPSLRAFAKFSYQHASPSLDYVLGNYSEVAFGSTLVLRESDYQSIESLC